MNILPKAVSKLIESFERLPGIGPKSAQRLAFYLLHVPQEELDRFAHAVQGLKSNTVLCATCKNVSESDPCPICESQTRDRSVICVVEQPTDVLSFERTGTYQGLYHVLHGSIDPLNGIGPDEIFIGQLLKRIKNEELSTKEVILAMNPNMEGEATAMYIQKQIDKLTAEQLTKRQSDQSTIINQQSSIRVTRLAHGLPMGADIEYADEVTLRRALEGRREY